ncbi:MAG: DctP family TRAP transporter solute-binding subunit [Lautropia sp.]|nr:DctP family TRAP transporter solute-binding subunit [Lautropia sp.]
MNLRRRTLATIATASALALACTTLPQTVLAQPKYKSEYKMSLVLGTAFPWGKGGEIWAKLVRERTDGRIDIKLYPGASLLQGDQTREFSALRQGVIDIAVGSTINWSPQIKQLNLFSLPFLLPDHAAIDALTQGDVGKELFSILDKAGVVPLAWGENGFREVSNSKHPIKTPADLKGLKVRVVGSPLYLETFSALGANPTQMSWADAQPAMASGAVDGQENPLSVYMAAKLQTLGQKYLTLWGYVADPLIFVVNKRVWASWTPEDQAIVRQAAIDAAREQIAIAREGLTEADQPLVKELTDMGVTVTKLAPAEREAFVTATKPVFDKWKAQIGPDLVDAAQAAIARRRQ